MAGIDVCHRFVRAGMDVWRRFVRALRENPWNVISGEWVLDQENGGARILVRSMLVSVLTYGVALIVKAASAKGAMWPSLDPAGVLPLINETLHWLGAIFGSLYIAFYSRFSSQWTYLSSVYNLIKQAEVSCTSDAGNQRALWEWKEAFMEECALLHLAKKRPFEARIREWRRQRHGVPIGSTPPLLPHDTVANGSQASSSDSDRTAAE